MNKELFWIMTIDKWQFIGCHKWIYYFLIYYYYQINKSYVYGKKGFFVKIFYIDLDDSLIRSCETKRQ